jgi:hypothetical protein
LAAKKLRIENVTMPAMREARRTRCLRGAAISRASATMVAQCSIEALTAMQGIPIRRLRLQPEQMLYSADTDESYC